MRQHDEPDRRVVQHENRSERLHNTLSLSSPSIITGALGEEDPMSLKGEDQVDVDEDFRVCTGEK